MAEAIIFILIVGILTIGALYAFGIQSVDPRIIVTILFLLLIPGFYAAVTSGPFVPSGRKRHLAMLKMADLGPDDVVYDLGCGDGRLVFHAAKFSKKTIGYELSVPLYLFGKLRQLVSKAGAEVRFGNIWKQDYKDADVIFCYLMPNAMKRFYREIWPKLKPGTRVISNAFRIHEVKPVKHEGKVYLYRV